ncbi:MAG: hypothetical protein JWR17_1183 [Pseudomonas sp.]|jgi:hypothetical protein|uniref:DUF4123 domain-containing protein n=1 Tax=Pseudomonas sp. TaxID=306 RepID=UPI0026286465|nr:DUF4123 domain-containing protein [Pseudomonas sp.]MDB6048437.1 hypothetical protein [Pseudomonas sp.]
MNHHHHWRYAPAPQNAWLLLDTLSTPGLAEQFKRRFDDSYVGDELFAHTQLHPLRDQGPLLIRMAPGSPLSQAFPQESEDWPGLIIVCAAPKQQLLAHLRRMLTVRFSEHLISVLTYYNVQTASYFFDGMDALELSLWMGPMESLTWYGGPWGDKVDDSQGRQFVINPKLNVPVLTVEPTLSLRQQNKLQQCLLERHAYQWNDAAGNHYRETLRHVHEGLGLGFNISAVLDEWLALRAMHPSNSVPSVLYGDTQRARLETLAHYWQGRRS